MEKPFPMGDSSYAHLTPRRLSKPQTNRSSPNLHDNQPNTPSSVHTVSELDYFGSDAVVVNSRGERRSRSKSRSRIKAYLYGPSHDVVQTSSDDDELQTGIAGAARDVRRRLSRTSSSVMSLQSAKAYASRLSNASSSGLLSTRSTDSQGTDPEESAMVADQIKQKAYHDSLAAQNHVSIPVDEDKHADSIMAPVRRKSLYTPGIATRNASDILRKPPKPLTDREYYYDPLRSENSPLSHLASLSVGEDGRSTPSDLHYSQLGGLQLGTLRVTNGASSPVPGRQPSNLAYRSVTPESKTNDEYYTASEGSVAGDREIVTHLHSRGQSLLKYESRINGSIGTDHQVPRSPDMSCQFERESSDGSFPFLREKVDQVARFESRATKQTVCSKSEILRDSPCLGKGTSNGPFSLEKRSSETCLVEAREPESLLTLEKAIPNKLWPGGNESNESPEKIEHSDEKKSKESFPLEMSSPKSCCAKTGTRNERNEYLHSEYETTDVVVGFERETLRKSLPLKPRSFRYDYVDGRDLDECCCLGEKFPNSASDLADEYLADLEDNPFSSISPEDRKAIIPQSHNSTKDVWRPFIVDANVQHVGNGSGSREDAFRKLTVNGDILSTWNPGSLKVSTSERPRRERPRRSASSEVPQPDSGYCSYASLTEAPAEEVCPERGISSIPSTAITASTLPQTAETVRSSARSSFLSRTRKLKKQRPKSQPPPVNLIAGHHELADVDIPLIPSNIASRHTDRLHRFPLLEHTFASSQHTSTYGTMSPDLAPDTLIRFPSPPNALEAASTPLGIFPTASFEPRARTVAIDEDGWGASDIVRSPSWSEFAGGRRRKEHKKLAKEEKETEKRLHKERIARERKSQKDRKDFKRQSKKPENKQRSIRSRSASRTRARSPEGQARHETRVTITDFGTVTESLGNSPYDIARSTLPNRGMARNWHPHEISTAMQRPKPSLGARAHAQSMFLDVPSVPALAAVDFEAHDLKWVRNRQRSQTSSVANAGSLCDRSGNPANVMRPQSIKIKNTPPVPHLPFANQVKQREVEIIRSRPHSMIVEVPVPIPTSRTIECKKATTRPSESGKRVTARKISDSKLVPAFWTNGSLERKSPKTVEESTQESNTLVDETDKAIPTMDDVWAAQSNAWSQRRKSAGEALLRNRVGNCFDGQEATNPILPCKHDDRAIPLARAFTSGTYQSLMPHGQPGPFPNPSASHLQLTAQQHDTESNTPGSHNRTTIQQTQRYDFSPLGTHPMSTVSCVAAFRPENQPSNFTSIRAQTQLFQIQRKRVGSGPLALRAEASTNSSR